jgi:4-alpha-glucanotransferase
MSGILSRFEDLQPFYGEFMDDTITVKPYGYTIIKARFVK